MLPLSLHTVVRKADPVHTASKLHVAAINIQLRQLLLQPVTCAGMWHMAPMQPEAPLHHTCGLGVSRRACIRLH